MEINRKDLEKLFKENYKGLYFYALSFINDESASEDIISDVFEYLWNNRTKIDISFSLKPFIYKMVKNRCINYLRHEDVKQKHMQISLNESEEINDEEERELLLQKIIDEIESFPKKRREVFKKCFLENKKYKEVGAELGISVNTVKTHITKSLLQLREHFNSNDVLLFILSSFSGKI